MDDDSDNNNNNNNNNSMKRKSVDIRHTGDDNNNNNNNDDDDGDGDDDEIDPSVHWERCQQSHKKRVKQMKEEKDKLQNEISTMNSVIGVGGANANKTGDGDGDGDGDDDGGGDGGGDDVIEIDAGGKIIRALRSTLTLAPDTMFTFMFSRRWEESLIRHDNRVFLDHDPELIEIIINFLRMKKIEDPTNPVQSPTVRIEKKNDFDYILRYFGLTDFFYPPPPPPKIKNGLLDIAKIEVVQPHDNDGLSTVVTKNEKKIQFSHYGNGYHFLACKPTLISSGEGSFWKVTIDALRARDGSCFFLGIIGNLNASKESLSDSTAHGWSSDGSVWKNGLPQHEICSVFTEGEFFYLHLKANTLTMFRVKTKQKFVIDINISIPSSTNNEQYYIHFNFIGPGTKISLEPANHLIAAV
jgi:hypothetical protein